MPGGALACLKRAGSLPSAGWTGMVRVSRLVTGAGVLAATACGIAVLVAAPTLLRLLYGPAFVTYAPSARVFAVSMVIARVRRRADSHPDHHTPSAPALHGAVGEVGLLCRGRVCVVHCLRGNWGSGGGSAHRCPHPCRGAGLAVLGSPIGRGDAAPPSRTTLGNRSTTAREKYQVSTCAVAGS